MANEAASRRAWLRAHAVDLPTWALLAWWWLFALAFTKERLLADAAYYVFRALCANAPWIEHERWALALPELPPLVAHWLGLPMRAVVTAFSIALPLFATLAYALMRWRWQVRAAGLLVVTPFLVALSAAHFSPLFELYFGVVAIAVWWVMPTSSRALRITRGALFLLGAGSHPSGPFLALFGVLLDRLLRPERMPWRDVAVWVALAVVAALPGRIAPSAYEQEKTRWLSEFLAQNSLRDQWTWFRDYLRFTWAQQPSACVVLVLGLARIAWLRGWKALLLCTAAIIALLVLLYLESPFPAVSRYQEQIQFPLVLVACWLTAALWDLDRWPRFLLLGVLCVGAVMAIWRTALLARTFTERIVRMEEVIDRARAQGLTKVQLPEAALTGEHGLDPNWSYSLESLLLSTAYHGGPVTIMPEGYGPTLNGGQGPRPDEFVVRDGMVMPLSDLPAPWDDLPAGPYVPMEPIR